MSRAGYYFKALPDVNITVEFQVAEGNMVLTYVTVRGTHQGELLGVSATGKRIEVTGMSVDRIERGKIVEGWVSWDQLGLLKQLGANPKPA
jgi:predicted ester cyclase